MGKMDNIRELLESRILRGDYAVVQFPSEVQLAQEIGASRTTVRGATLDLIDKGLLRREVSGRLTVARDRSADRPLHIWFLLPSLEPEVVQWGWAAEKIVRSYGGHVRSMTYTHWNDPVLLDVCRNADGIFLMPPVAAMPPEIAAKLRTAHARVVLMADYAADGLHCMNVVNPTSVAPLLGHLAALGHRRVAAFNTQPVDYIIQRRLDNWAAWLAHHGCSGELVNEAEPMFGNPQDRAYAVAKERLSSGDGFGGTAVLCITMPAALGLVRAMYEQDLKVGRDISVCCAFDEGAAQFMYPTLTSLQMATPEDLMRTCLDWMAGGEWQGPLLMRASTGNLFVGASTGPPLSRSAPYHRGRSPGNDE